MSASSQGRIITFYSYKGGTGRSMALANTAWALANNKQRVLVVDWDLEAPGVHRYFHPFLPDKMLTNSKGLMDLVLDYASEAIMPPDEAEHASETLPTPDELGQQEWFRARADILPYVKSLKGWNFPGEGTIDLLPAGRQDVAYATRVNSFDWHDFYKKLSGGLFFQAVREQMRAEYDYILIDSRTGVSDTAGICTVEMPDALVICFTLNNQSIDGACGVASSVSQQRKDLPIFPVPTRLHNAEQKKMDRQLDRAYTKFAGFPQQLSGKEREAYWRHVAIPYSSNFAFEEILAAFGEKHRLTHSIASAAERLTGYLAPGQEWRVEIQEELRQKFLAEFEGGTPQLSADPTRSPVAFAEQVYLRLGPDEQKVAYRLFLRLALAARAEGEETRRGIPLNEFDAQTSRLADRLEAEGLLQRTRREEQSCIGFAHERVAREWPRLQGWIEEEQAFLGWLEQLGEQARAWERSGRKREALLPTYRLEIANQWTNRFELLTRSEREFLAAHAVPAATEAAPSPAPITERPPARSSYDAYISYDVQDLSFVGELIDELSHYSPPGLRARTLRFATQDDPGKASRGPLSQVVKDSRHGILVASRAASRSATVHAEVQALLALHGPERLIIVLLDGEIVWDYHRGDFDWSRTTALPLTLKGVFKSAPHYEDLRLTKNRRAAFPRLSARLHDQVPEIMFADRYLQSRRQNQSLIVIVATVTLTALGLGITAAKAMRDLSRTLTEKDKALAEQSKALAMADLQAELFVTRSRATTSKVAQLLSDADGPALQSTSKDGRFLLVGGAYAYRLLDMSERTPRELMVTRGVIQASSFSPDNQLLVVGMQTGQLVFWTLPPEKSAKGKAQQLTAFQVLPPVRRLKFSPDGKWILALQEGGTALLLNPQGEQVRDFKSASAIQSVGFSPDGQQITLLGANEVCTLKIEAKEPACASFLEPPVQEPIQQQVLPLPQGPTGPDAPNSP